MSGRTAPHYGFRVARSMVPCVEVTEGHRSLTTFLVTGDHNHVVKRVYGFNIGHAISRAQKWMRKHGDPR